MPMKDDLGIFEPVSSTGMKDDLGIFEQPRQLGGRALEYSPYEEMIPGIPVMAGMRAGKEVAKGFTRTVQNTLSGLGGLMEYTGHLAERYPGEVVNRPDLEPDSLLGEHAGQFTGPQTRTPVSTQDPLTQFAKVGGKAAREYWGEAANDPILKPRVESYTDIKSIADGIDYASTGVGNLAGSLAITALMPGVYKPTEWAGVAIKEGAKRGLGGRILNFLRPHAMDVPIGVMEGGEIANKQLEQFEKDGTDLSLSRLVATAVPATLIERGLGVEALAAKMGRMGPEAREFSKKKLIPRILQGMGITGAEEGAEEFVQTYLENYGGDPKSAWTKEALHDAINSGLQGMIGGHVMGGMGGAVARRQYEDVQGQQRRQQEVLVGPVDLQDPRAPSRIESRANIARYLEDFIAETDPALAKSWGEYAAQQIGNNQPIDLGMLTKSGAFDVSNYNEQPPSGPDAGTPAAGGPSPTPPVMAEAQAEKKAADDFITKVEEELHKGAYSMDDLEALHQNYTEALGEGHPVVARLDALMQKYSSPVAQGILTANILHNQSSGEVIDNGQMQAETEAVEPRTEGGATPPSETASGWQPSRATYTAGYEPTLAQDLDDLYRNTLKPLVAGDPLLEKEDTRASLDRIRTSAIEYLRRVHGHEETEESPGRVPGSREAGTRQPGELDRRIHSAVQTARRGAIGAAILNAYREQFTGNDDLETRQIRDAAVNELGTNPQRRGLFEQAVGAIADGSLADPSIQQAIDLGIPIPARFLQTSTPEATATPVAAAERPAPAPAKPAKAERAKKRLEGKAEVAPAETTPVTPKEPARKKAKPATGVRPFSPYTKDGKPKSLFKIVQELGGLSQKKIVAAGYNLKQDFIEHKLTMVFRKDGRGLDDMASELVSMGIIQETPPELNSDDWLLKLLQDERRGVEVTISRIEAAAEVLQSQVDDAILEVKEALREDGLSDAQIQEGLGQIQREAQEAVDSQSPEERLEDGQGIVREALDEDLFVREEEAPAEEPPAISLKDKSTKELVSDIADILNDELSDLLGKRGSLSLAQIPEDRKEGLYQRLKPYIIELFARAKAYLKDRYNRMAAEIYVDGAIDALDDNLKEAFRYSSQRYMDEELFAGADVEAAAKEAAMSPENDLPEPSQAQVEAGNYKKGHVSIQGLDVSIENPRGSTRSGVSRDGKKWETEMKAHYGYIRGTKGKDKDHIDVFIGEDPQSDQVFVVNQVDPATGSFDEHKVMVGYHSLEEARKGYLENYQPGWKGLGDIKAMSMDEFKTWLQEGDTTKRAPEGGELFDTSGMFTLSGAQPYEPKKMKTQGKKGERLVDVEKQDVDELQDRLSGEKAKREYEKEKAEELKTPVDEAVELYKQLQETYTSELHSKLYKDVLRRLTSTERAEWAKRVKKLMPKEETIQPAAETTETPAKAKPPKESYPVFIDPWSKKEHRCIAFAVDPRIGWEWFGFEKSGKGIYYGFVHGFEDEWGSWSADELKENGIKPTTDPRELQQIMPPVGWEKKQPAEGPLPKKGTGEWQVARSEKGHRERLEQFWKEARAAWAVDTDMPYDEAKDRFTVELTAQDLHLSEVESEEELYYQLVNYWNREKKEQRRKLKNKAATEITEVADWVFAALEREQSFTREDLARQGEAAFGSKLSEGKYNWKDLFDAMELGINRFISESDRTMAGLSPILDANYARQAVDLIRTHILDKMPSQSGIRSAEQDEFQQFSTPPDLAYVMSWVANIGRRDTVLEPSAGIGGLGVFAKKAGAKVIVNELSERRANLLKQLDFDRVFNENAEQINNILPGDVKPTVVIMNPPFSSTAGRMQGTRDSANVTKHIGQALKRLQPGGRLVVLVAKGFMGKEPKVFNSWLKLVAENHSVVADVTISGEGYKKYGTTYDTRLLVIDKKKGGAKIVKGSVDDVRDVIGLLEGVRNGRTRQREQLAGESEGEGTVGKGKGKAGSEQPVLPAAGSLGGGRESPHGARTEPGAPAVRTPRVETGERHEVPGRRRGPGVEGGPAGGRPGGVGEPGARSDRQPAPVDAGVQRERKLSEIQLVESKEENQPTAEITDSLYTRYQPKKVRIKDAQPHPGMLVESAAMSSIDPPDATHTPNLPAKTIRDGLISDAQLESVVYAGQAHSEVLPNGSRQGFFIGDGTGVGKGREIAGIIWDNFRQGRKKAVWVSQNKPLITDAKRDVGDVGFDKDLIHDLQKTKMGETIGARHGVVFATYDTLKGRKEGKKSRVEQLADWFGADYDGVIVFDESHNMGNAVPMKGKRGTSKPAAKALAGVELQSLLPNARVVYVSATGATEVMNFSYAERLGLWGEGTSFANTGDFITQISAGGLGAMELIARDLKATGKYLARTLSYDDVAYDRLVHDLTKEQVSIYNDLAEAWQIVLNNINEALKAIGVVGTNHSGQTVTLNKQAKSAAMSAFWGSHQRFFNQVITSMQLPSVIDAIEKDLEKGYAPVLQFVNTDQAQQERALARLGEEEEIEDLDLTPRDQLMEFIKHSFPVYQYETQTDEEGNEFSVLVHDSEGKPVISQEAVAMREALLDKLGGIKVPESPLTFILDHFGIDKVAEVTGRTRRVVYVTDDKGTHRTAQRWSKEKAEADADAFMADKKQILIFSYAGGTGKSYHADRRAKNQRKRVHYLVQPGFRADRAVQGFGRTHRTNQAQAPEYILVTTNLHGQKRFISSIARRLDQLGALTKGQRQTGSQGLFSSRDNLESQEARDAFRKLVEDIHFGQVPEIDMPDFERQTGLRFVDPRTGSLNKDLPEITQFLNRTLSMKVETQNQVFDLFAERIDYFVAKAIENGTLDVGLETLLPVRARKVSEQVVYTDEKTGAETKYIEAELTYNRKLLPFSESAKFAKGGYVKNIKSGKVWAVSKQTTSTDRYGGVHDVHVATGVGYSRHNIPVDELQDAEKYETLGEKAADTLWQKELEAAKEWQEYNVTYHLITGLILPVWSRLPESNFKIVRLLITGGEQLLGRVIPEKHLQDTLARLGASRSDVKMDPRETLNNVLHNNFEVELANRWVLKRRTVQGEQRIEITGDFSHYDFKNYERYGLFSERISYQTRYFVPTNEQGVKAIEALTKNNSIVSAQKKHKASETIAQHSDTSFKKGSYPGVTYPEKPKYGVNTVKAFLQPVLRKLHNVGNIQVVKNQSEIPFDLAQRTGLMAAAAEDEEIFGMYDPLTDTTFIFADAIAGQKEAQTILIHEVIGHRGVMQILSPAERATTYQALMKEYRDSQELEQVVKDYDLDLSKEEDRYVASKELIAHLAERKGKPTLWTKIVDIVKRALARLGFKNFEETDIERLIRRSWEYAKGQAAQAQRTGRERTSRSQRRYAPVFFSQLTNTVRRKFDDMPAKSQSVIPWLQRQGVKPMELEEMGVSDWLKANQKDGRIDKAAFAEWVKANRLDALEVLKSSGDTHPWENGEYGVSYGYSKEHRGWLVWTNYELEILKESDETLGGSDNPAVFSTEAAAREAALSQVELVAPDWAADVADIKYDQYALSGGENYHEMLFTLPGTLADENAIDRMSLEQLQRFYRHVDRNGFDTLEDEETNDAATLRSIVKENLPAWMEDRQPGEIDNYFRVVLNDKTYFSSHWSEPNVLAHARFQDFTDAQGDRVLLVEEVQSDWHQEGKRKGYRDPKKREEVQNQIAQYMPVHRQNSQAWTLSQMESFNVPEGLRNEWWELFMTRKADAVPPAPFRQNWHEYVMKRMLRYAAENGYDKIAWTPGEEQANRYDLSKHLDRIEYEPIYDEDTGEKTGLYEIIAFDKSGWGVIHEDEITLNRVEELVGKEIAVRIERGEGQKIEDRPYREWRSLSGLDLKVGGKGMEVFYDQLIPGFMNKYVKQWGAKVGQTKITTEKRVGEDVTPGLLKEAAQKAKQDGEQSIAKFLNEQADRLAADGNYSYGVHNSNRWEGTDKSPAYYLDEVRRYEDQQNTVPSIPITPAMKEAVLYEGQPLYKKQVVDKEQKTFAATLDKYLSGELGHRLAIAVSSTPVVLARLGAKSLPVIMMDTTVDKVLRDKHGLSVETLKQLPGQLHDPIAVFDSSTEPGAFVFMTELKNTRGENLIAAVHLSIQYGRHELNKVASVHGREDGWFEREAKKGRLRYVNREKALNWSMTAKRLISPGVRGPNQGSERSVLTERDFVKSDEKPSFRKAKVDRKEEGKLRTEVRADMAALRDVTGSPVWEEIFKSPEWYDHPQISKLVDLFTEERSRLYHETFHDLTDGDSEVGIIDELAKLKKKGMSLADRARGRVSVEYMQLEDLLDEGDAKKIPPHKMERLMEERGVSPDVVSAWRRVRGSFDKALDKMLAQMREIVADLERKGGKEPVVFGFEANSTKNTGRWTLIPAGQFDSFFIATVDTAKKYGLRPVAGINYVMGKKKEDGSLAVQAIHFKKERFSEEDAERWWNNHSHEFYCHKDTPIQSTYKALQWAMASLNEWRGSYAPRIRPAGDWMMRAIRGEGEDTEVFRTHGSHRQLVKLQKEFEDDGWKTQLERLERLPETVYQNVRLVEAANLIDQALGKVGGTDISDKFHDELVGSVADVIRARGYRQTMIKRGKKLVTGYITDPLERYIRYVSSISGGLSKSEIARKAVSIFGEIDPVKQRRRHDFAQKYIEEQLRNMERGDKLLGLAKSIATVKYLGFNVRSMLVNLTALATTVPAAIHQYGLEGKVGMARIGVELTKASKDFGKHMAGGKLSGADQAFVDFLRKEGYDDPQYTRDAIGKIQGAYGNAWSKVMSAAMILFKLSEQFNRGTTMLAAYRLAKAKGFSEDEARRRAKVSSDRAHGIYGKGTLPSWALGTGLTERAGQLLYTYGKFGHNYVQMCYDLRFKKRNLAAFTWAMVTPLVIGGGMVLPFREELAALVNVLLRALGIDTDPEKWWWDKVRRWFGRKGEQVGRHGLMGLAGLDISGSLSIGVGLPRGLMDLAGPAGGLFTDIAEGGRLMGAGQKGLGIAKALLPTGLERPLRAYEEDRRGYLSGRARRLWTPQGPYMPTPWETAGRAAGFRPARMATEMERQSESKRVEQRFTDRREKIYERVRNATVDRSDMSGILRDVTKYNLDVARSGMAGVVPYIKRNQIMRQRKSMSFPGKKEQRRVMER